MKDHENEVGWGQRGRKEKFFRELLAQGGFYRAGSSELKFWALEKQRRKRAV